MERTRSGCVAVTHRQREVLDLLAKGHTNGEIAERLGISLDGVKWHVSELLNRFGVETRDDLVDAWTAERRPVARAKRWLSGAAGLCGLKPLALSSAMVVVSAGGLVMSAFALAVLVSAARDEEPPSPSPTPDASATAAATPAPPRPAAALPAAPPDSAWTPREAFAIAAGVAAEYLAAPALQAALQRTPAMADLALVEATWLPAIGSYVSATPEYRWEPTDGAVRDVWQFRWQATDLPVSPDWPAAGMIVTLEVEVLLEDGKPDPLATRASLNDPAGGSTQPVVRMGAFTDPGLRASIDRTAGDRIALTVPVPFGWRNGDPESDWMGAYLSATGRWCVGYYRAGTTDLSDFACVDPAETREGWAASVAVHADGSLAGPYVLAPRLPAAAVRIEVSTGDGQVRSFPTYAPPAQSGIQLRFAFVALDEIGDGVTVVAYDADGNALVRHTHGRPVPPPPPPPPSPAAP